jgi:dTMP kinase
VGGGLFITFEGVEGSGKSTQVSLLAARLRELGREVVTTREPGGTPTGEMIRDILQHHKSQEPITERTEALLFAASRAQHVARVIRPAVDRGAVVICDRYLDSTLAYQGFGRSMPLDGLRAINGFGIEGMQPGLTLLLDLDVVDALARMRRRQQELAVAADRFEREASAFHQRVRDGFLALAAAEPARFRIVNANQEPGAVFAAVWQAVQERL